MKIKHLTLAALMAAAIISAPGLAYPDGPKDETTAPEKEEGAVTYKIVPHDTLWDISRKFLKNPFKWPRIWKQNPYIKNPDLIYPGNIVRISPDGGIEVVEKKTAETEATKETKELPVVTLGQPEEKTVVLEPEAPPAREMKEAPAQAAPPAPKVSSAAMQRTGFVSGKEIEAGEIVGAREKEGELYVTSGDKVILSFKDREAAKKGDRYNIYLEGRRIYHPVTKAYVGALTENLGSLTITDTGGHIEGVIDTSYEEIPMNAKLHTFKEPVREVEITNPESEVTGYIIASMEDKEQLSAGDIVYIDKGGKDGLKKGNIMKIFRERGEITDPLNRGNMITLPPFDLGTLIVVDANDDISSCVIMKSLMQINLGDKAGTSQIKKEVSEAATGIKE